MQKMAINIICPCCGNAIQWDEVDGGVCLGEDTSTISIPTNLMTPEFKAQFEELLDKQKQMRDQDRENFKKQFGKLPLGTTDPEDESLDYDRESCK